MYEIIKAKVKFELDQADFISLTTDSWTCQHTTQSVYSLTARFLTSEYKIKNVILQITHFPKLHTAANISKFFNKSLHNWQISLVKVCTISTDIAANVVSAINQSELTFTICHTHYATLYSK